VLLRSTLPSASSGLFVQMKSAESVEALHCLIRAPKKLYLQLSDLSKTSHAFALTRLEMARHELTTLHGLIAADGGAPNERCGA